MSLIVSCCFKRYTFQWLRAALPEYVVIVDA